MKIAKIIIASLLGIVIFGFIYGYFYGFTPTQLRAYGKVFKSFPSVPITIRGNLRNNSNDYRRYVISDGQYQVDVDLPLEVTLLDRAKFAEKNKVISGASNAKVRGRVYFQPFSLPINGASIKGFDMKTTVEPSDIKYLGSQTVNQEELQKTGMGNLIGGYSGNFILSQAIELFQNSSLPASGYAIVRPSDAPYDSTTGGWNFVTSGKDEKGNQSDELYMQVQKTSIEIYSNYHGDISFQNNEAVRVGGWAIPQ